MDKAYARKRRAKALAQRMKALRARCTSPKDFHELRQGFSPPNGALQYLR